MSPTMQTEIHDSSFITFFFTQLSPPLSFWWLKTSGRSSSPFWCRTCDVPALLEVVAMPRVHNGFRTFTPLYVSRRWKDACLSIRHVRTGGGTAPRTGKRVCWTLRISEVKEQSDSRERRRKVGLRNETGKAAAISYEIHDRYEGVFSGTAILVVQRPSMERRIPSFVSSVNRISGSTRRLLNSSDPVTAGTDSSSQGAATNRATGTTSMLTHAFRTYWTIYHVCPYLSTTCVGCMSWHDTNCPPECGLHTGERHWLQHLGFNPAYPKCRSWILKGVKCAAPHPHAIGGHTCLEFKILCCNF